MNITVIGAAGRLGWRVVEEASRRGHKVAGLARHPERLARPDPLCNIAAGDGRADVVLRGLAEQAYLLRARSDRDGLDWRAT